MRPKKLVKALSLVSLCGITALLSGGCVDNRTSLFLHHVFRFEPGGDCEINADLGDAPLAAGKWNPNLFGGGYPYVAQLIVGNGLQTVGDNDTLRPETSRIQVEGAEVSIAGANGGTAAPSYTVPLAGTLEPDDSEDPGVTALLGVPLIPPGFGLADGSYTLTIVLFGRTLGGKELESGEFYFPVTIDSRSGYVCGVPEEAVEGSRHPCDLPQDGLVLYHEVCP